ncbi:hypothetical protein FVEG_16936 [Fusarium verticillioides 7600]|uniref:DUF7702 domain-containing protein n=1 Tax=Gibberella moniliformis (strain M3125 / FGSC 7600) TaxID=334819 RepID=W7MWU1_GIBM7|nr:hypothetical protein FVEG_16936 [Fusarium verticillioides 7600]EWG52165.1 hypothetical protein FVEG_16936 [Fusarium verticillioides 7600]
MVLDSWSIVAIVQLAAYIPAICLAIYICNLHGFSKSSGWYYTVTLSVCRIVGAACQLISIDNKSTGLLEAVMILNHIGLVPLMLSTLGMLSRLADVINAQLTDPAISIRYFRLMQLIMLLGAVFGIIGVESKSSSGTSPSAWSYAGVLCYAAGFCLLVGILAKSISVVRLAPTRERILVPAVGLALPLVFVRLLYQILLVFVHSGHFVLIKGSVLVFVFITYNEVSSRR